MDKHEQALLDGIAAGGYATESQSPAPELPEPVATPRTVALHRSIELTMTPYPAAYEEMKEHATGLECELTAERERADAAVRNLRNILDTDLTAKALSEQEAAVEQAESQRDAAVALLREHGIAINVWMTTYASDMCDEKDVKKARDILNESGGTLAYAADLNAKREEFLRGIE